jgi:KDO2-lipid IV(A) lauroyltransferase
VEICLLPFESNKTISDKTRFYGLEHFNEALLAKKGVLILSQHVGNGDVGVVRLVNQKIFFNLISKKFKNKLANDFWFGIREKMGVKFIEPHGNSTAFDILKCLKQNQPVAFVLDQFMSIPYGIETEFFGRKTGTAYGLALFAIRTGAPVVPVHVYRDSDFITHVVFEKPLPLIENPDKDTQIKLLTQSYNDKIEAIVRQYPDQWMWVHRRWKVFG